jgi:hypothetical protein
MQKLYKIVGHDAVTHEYLFDKLYLDEDKAQTAHEEFTIDYPGMYFYFYASVYLDEDRSIVFVQRKG